MSTTISVKDGSQSIKESPIKFDAEQERVWSALASAIGYPESWMSTLRTTLQRSGKTWQWHEQELETVARGKLEQGGKVLLIINASTPSKAISNALLLAESCDATILVVYTARPPLLSEERTLAEVDSDFATELEFGRFKLSRVEREAKDIGVSVETKFIWSNSMDEISKNAPDSDLVINETA